MSGDYREGCAAPECTVGSFLDGPHLRAQLSPPGQPWTMLRYCDLICMIAWLEHEAQSATPSVFCNEDWIDSRE